MRHRRSSNRRFLSSIPIPTRFAPLDVLGCIIFSSLSRPSHRSNTCLLTIVIFVTASWPWWINHRFRSAHISPHHRTIPGGGIRSCQVRSVFYLSDISGYSTSCMAFFFLTLGTTENGEPNAMPNFRIVQLLRKNAKQLRFTRRSKISTIITSRTISEWTKPGSGCEKTPRNFWPREKTQLPAGPHGTALQS